MQQSHEQQQEELQALHEELQTLRQRREGEKEEQGRQDQEALALLTQQGERAEESARQLAVKLQEKVSIQRCHRSTAQCLWYTKRGKIATTCLSVNKVPVPEDDPQTSLWPILHANEFSHWLLCLV